MNELEKLIALSKEVAKPWVIATWVLAILLGLSVAGNIYMMTQKTSVIIEQENNLSDHNINANMG